MREILELLRRLGEAILELVAAEVDALAGDLRRGGRDAARAVLLYAVGAVLAVLAWSLFTLALVWGLALAIGQWQAALAVGAAYALAAIGCALAGRRRWRRIEPPAATVKRRWNEQSQWLRERVLALPPSEPGSDDDG